MRRLGPAGWPSLLLSLLGLALRIQFAATFNGHVRGADYDRHFSGMYWTLHHWRAFNFAPEVNWTVSNYPPGWYMTAAVLYLIFHTERSAAIISVTGWAVRQFLFSRLLLQAMPHRRWIVFLALTITAFLPISVETDGTTNPEAMHSSLFMIAAYFLWRIERESVRPNGISFRTAGTFGLIAGLGMMTKATSSVLPMALVAVMIWQVYATRQNGTAWRVVWKQLLLPAVFAGTVWSVVAGWWIVPNLIKYGHPFPHAWDLSPPAAIPEMFQPVWNRRPLGWALPFYWKHYLSEPMLQSYLFPPPNLWGQFVAGTWSDIINRGFCQIEGGGVFTKYFDGWPVSGRCMRLLSWVAHIGVFVTVIAVGCLFRTLWNHLLSAGKKGSLALPLLAIFVVFFTALFTLTYPVDGMVSTNPRYLLPASLPIAACLALGLSDIERPWLRRGLTAVMTVTAVVVAVMVTYERWGI